MGAPCAAINTWRDGGDGATGTPKTSKRAGPGRRLCGGVPDGFPPFDIPGGRDCFDPDAHCAVGNVRGGRRSGGGGAGRLLEFDGEHMTLCRRVK